MSFYGITAADNGGFNFILIYLNSHLLVVKRILNGEMHFPLVP